MLDIKISTSSRNFVKYDNSLFEVYTIDYGDNYHRSESEPSSEFEREVRKIKARYKDITKYNAACALYAEYIRYLEDKYGGPEIFKLRRKAGTINEFIPPKPRIKNTKELKFLKKNKIIIGSVGRFLIDEEAFDRVTESYEESMIPENISVEKLKDKEAEKILDSDDFKYKNKYKHLKSQSFKSDADFLESYFRNKNYYNNFSKKKKNKKKNKKDKQNNESIMISDFMRSDYEDYYYGADHMEDSDTAPIVMYNNMLLSAGTTKELDVYHKLNELGWNSYKLMKKGPYSTRVTNMFKPPKKKKKGKKNKKEGIYDGLLIDIMSDNGFDVEDMDSFAEFQEEMLNMTSENIFK